MEALKYLSLISQVGFTMVTPILLCTFLGMKLEERFHFPFTLIFMLIGVISGCMSGFRLIMNTIKRMDKKKEENLQKQENTFILSLAAIPFAGIMKYSVYPIELGILIGSVLVIGMVIDMGISTEDSLYGGNPSFAQRKIMIHSLLRKAALFIVVAIFWNSRYINALAIVISVFGLKSGAYMYPLFKKIFEKRRKEET